jgi:mRNA interferase MazF
MTLAFHPRRGTVLYCDFTTGFVAPEMVKKRPVVVVSGTKHGMVCTVIPLSTSEPTTIERWHHLITDISLPNALRHARTWAKCDMITTVALRRLDRVKDGVKVDGKTNYVAHRVSDADLLAIENGIIAALRMEHLTHPAA